MTEPDSTRHNATTQLSDRQIAAIEALVAAGTQTDAALAAGVTRQTVSTWVNHHYGFIAELNRQRNERLDNCADKVQIAVSEALDHVLEQIGQSNTSVVMAILKLVGLGHLRTAQTGEPQDPQRVRRRVIDNEYARLSKEPHYRDLVGERLDKQAKRAFDLGQSFNQ
jgi:hypothetical protein